MVEAAVAAFSRSSQPHPLPPPSPLTPLPLLRHFLLRVSLISLFLQQLFTFISPNLHFSTDVNLTCTAFFFFSLSFFAPTFGSCMSPCHALGQVRFPPPPRLPCSPLRRLYLRGVPERRCVYPVGATRCLTCRSFIQRDRCVTEAGRRRGRGGHREIFGRRGNQFHRELRERGGRTFFLSLSLSLSLFPVSPPSLCLSCSLSSHLRLHFPSPPP